MRKSESAASSSVHCMPPPLVWQIAHEADGVGEQPRLLVRQGDLSRRRIKGREKFVLYQHIRAVRSTQQRRFADVGVADNGRVRDGRALPVLSLRGARTTHGL